MLEYLNTVYNQLHIYFVPVLLSFLAGLATVIGGFITFIVKKDNIKMLSLGLGFSAGVMIFLSLTEIKSCAEELLTKYFPNHFIWYTFLGFILGVLIAFCIDYFIPNQVNRQHLREENLLLVNTEIFEKFLKTFKEDQWK